MPKILLR